MKTKKEETLKRLHNAFADIRSGRSLFEMPIESDVLTKPKDEER